MTHYTLHPDTGPDLEFEGTVVAEVTSEARHKPSWSVLRIYKTDAGALVAESVAYVRCADGLPDVDHSRAAVCKAERDVVEFFHRGRPPSKLTKGLLDLAGIDHTEVVP